MWTFYNSSGEQMIIDGGMSNVVEDTTPQLGANLDMNDFGLAFPATQSADAGANVLDDYEEGTFTPTLLDNTLSASESQGYGTQLGFYTKIGNRVLWSLTLVMSSVGSLTTSQQARVGGLPFVAQNTTSLFGSAYTGFGNDLNMGAASTGPISGSIAPNTSYISLWEWDATTGINSVLISEVSADGSLYMAGQYQTAT